MSHLRKHIFVVLPINGNEVTQYVAKLPKAGSSRTHYISVLGFSKKVTLSSNGNSL